MKILYLVTEDWYFCSHRLALAKAARARGHDVVVVTRVREHGDVIRQAGLVLIPFENKRGGANPISELSTLFRLIRIYRIQCADLVHHVAMKPVIYGSIAALLARTPRIVNALTGLGWLFSSHDHLAKVLKFGIRPVLGLLLRRSKVIVQNIDDDALVRSLRVRDVHIVSGSGVDAEKFHPTATPGGVPVVMLVARLLRDKGVEEFAAAARMLQSRGVSARFVLVGAPDPENRSSVPQDLIESWVAQGWVEWWGRRDDMPEVLSQAHIACLPSYYREGLPKSLIEAAACGLPIVTTDMPGCREIAVDGHNGFLVPIRTVSPLAKAIERLVLDERLRTEMGQRGRAMVLDRFTDAHIIQATLDVYEEFDSSQHKTIKSRIERL